MHAHSFNFTSSFIVKGSGIKCKGPCSKIILETLKESSKKHKFHIYSAGKIYMRTLPVIKQMHQFIIAEIIYVIRLNEDYKTEYKKDK